MRYYSKRPTREALRIAHALYTGAPLPKRKVKTMSASNSEVGAGTAAKSQTSANKPKGVKFGETDLGKPPDFNEFIKAEDLSHISRFHITGARLRRSNLNPGGSEWAFEIAWRSADNEVQRRTLTLAQNEDRDRIAAAVKKHGLIRDVRLDRIEVKGNKNGYWKFVDADTERAVETDEDEEHAGPADDDIPF